MKQYNFTVCVIPKDEQHDQLGWTGIQAYIKELLEETGFEHVRVEEPHEMRSVLRITTPMRELRPGRQPLPSAKQLEADAKHKHK